MEKPGAREETLGNYEMLWDCPHCESKKLLGKTHRHCPNCGAPQDETKRYFPTDADKVKVEDHVFTGGDKKCASCGAAQSSKASNCGQCGAPLGEAKSVPLVTEAKPATKKKSNLLYYILFGIVVFGVLIWFMCIRKKEMQMTVTGHRWAAAQEIEEYREVGEQAWRNEVPTGGRQLACTQKERSTRQVQDGEDCKVERVDNGDGTFREVNKCTPRMKSESVNDDFCTYRIERWTKVEELKATGKGLDVLWPVVPASKVPAGIGAVRAGKRDAVYTVELNDGKNNRTCDVSEATWKKYRDGQKIKAKVRARSGEIVCSEL